MAHHTHARARASPSRHRRSARGRSRRSKVAFFAALVVAVMASRAAADSQVPHLLARPGPDPAVRAAIESKPIVPSTQARDAAPGAGRGARAERSATSGSASPRSEASGAASPVPAPTSKEGAPDDSVPFWMRFDAIPLFGAVAGLAVTAMLLRGLAARKGRLGRGPDGVVEILARYPVGRGQQILLVRVGRRVIVAHQADKSMRALAETADPDEVAELMAKSREQGGDLFARLLDRGRAESDPFADADMVDLTRDRANGGARR